MHPANQSTTATQPFSSYMFVGKRTCPSFTACSEPISMPCGNIQGNMLTKIHYYLSSAFFGCNRYQNYKITEECSCIANLKHIICLLRFIYIQFIARHPINSIIDENRFLTPLRVQDPNIFNYTMKLTSPASRLLKGKLLGNARKKEEEAIFYMHLAKIISSEFCID